MKEVLAILYTKITNVIIDKNIVIRENTILQGDEQFPVVIEKKVQPYQF